MQASLALAAPKIQGSNAAELLVQGSKPNGLSRFSHRFTPVINSSRFKVQGSRFKVQGSKPSGLSWLPTEAAKPPFKVMSFQAMIFVATRQS